MIEQLFEALAAMNNVEAIALGGSRAGSVFDEKSDYDVYVYCTGNIPENDRKQLLSKYCSAMEIGNHFWEYEDNCILQNGIDIDILYRDLNVFCEEVAAVVEKCEARNGYTTCMWHNLKNCKIVYDANGKLAEAKKRFDVEYPIQLKKNIIERNMRLLHDALPAYDTQIVKAINRNDIVSINHRTAAFMESYFDILFALNEKTHPGEKRLIALCKKQCDWLPHNFEDNLNRLFRDLYENKNDVKKDLEIIIKELKTCLTSA